MRVYILLRVGRSEGNSILGVYDSTYAARKSCSIDLQWELDDLGYISWINSIDYYSIEGWEVEKEND